MTSLMPIQYTCNEKRPLYEADVFKIAHAQRRKRGTEALVEMPHEFHNRKVSESEGILHRETKGAASL